METPENWEETIKDLADKDNWIHVHPGTLIGVIQGLLQSEKMRIERHSTSFLDALVVTAKQEGATQMRFSLEGWEELKTQLLAIINPLDK